MKKNIVIVILLMLLISMVLKLPDAILSKKIENHYIDKPVIVAKSIEVLSLPDKINSWNLSEENWRWFFTDKGINRPLFYNGRDVSFARLSPSYRKLGFFFRPEDHSLGEIVLAILDIDRKFVKEVYHGDNRTSNWEWKNDEAVIVNHSCGTACMAAYVIDLQTREEIDEYRVY